MLKAMLVEFVSEDLRACRICLATNIKLYNISEGLEDNFVELMGVEFSDDDGLPQHLCPYCRMLLSRCADLRARCQRSEQLLQQILTVQPFLSTDDIVTIDRNFYKLAPNLSQLGVYTFDSHKKKETIIIQAEDPQLEEDNFDDRKDFSDVRREVIDLLSDDATDEEVVIDNNVVPDIMEEVTIDSNEPVVNNLEQATPHLKSNLLFEIDGLNMGRIRIKTVAQEENSKTVAQEENSKTVVIEEKSKTVAKEEKIKEMRTQFTKQNAERVAKRKEVKTKQISRLLRYVTGKKRNAKPLTKWQLQLRRAENDFLPNFNYAEFETQHECELKILTTEEQLEEIEERKQSSNYLNLDFKCESCGRGFEFERSYKNHMMKHDPRNGKFECEVCHIRFRTQYLRLRHLDYHKMKFACNICCFVTRAKHLARNHYLMHTGKVFKCKQCDATFMKSTSYLGHVRLNHPSWDAVCELCGDSFIGALGLRHHKAKAHKELPKYKCGSCGVEFASLDAKNRHKDERGKCDGSMKACPECGEVFSSEQLLQQHAGARHPLVQYLCGQEGCSQAFASAASLDTHHQRVHLRVKWPAYGRTREMNKEYYRKIKERTRLSAQVVCERCGAKVQSTAALERHQRGHCRREYEPRAASYKCHYCDKACATRQGLQMHMYLHTGEKPYKCPHCPLEFRQPGARNRHRDTVHLGIDIRVQCEYCGKYFSTPSSRKLHVNTVHLKMPAPSRARRSRAQED